VDRESKFLVGVPGEGHPRGLALPGGRRARRLVGVCDLFFQEGFAAAKLDDDGEEFSGVIGCATVGGVVAIPGCVGVLGIELGKSCGSDVTPGPIDNQPSTTLPSPTRSGFGGESIIDAEQVTDDEEIVCDVMRSSEGVGFYDAIDEQRANPDFEWLVFTYSGQNAGACPASEGDDVSFGGSPDSDREEGEDEKPCYMAHTVTLSSNKLWWQGHSAHTLRHCPNLGM